MKHLVFILLLLPFVSFSQLDTAFILIGSPGTLTTPNDSIFRGTFTFKYDQYNENYAPSGITTTMHLLDGAGREYRVKVKNSTTTSTANLDILDFLNYNVKPTGQCVIYEPTDPYELIPVPHNVASYGVSTILLSKIHIHNLMKIKAEIERIDTTGGVGSGDDWGAQVVIHNNTLTGQGTSGDHLSVNPDTFPNRQTLIDSITAAKAYADALHAADLDKDTTNEIQALSILAQNISLSKSGGTIDITESAQDIVGAMVSSNTETGITVTYDDSGGKLNFSVTGAASQLQYYEFTRGDAVISCIATDTTGTSFSKNAGTGTGTLVIPSGVKYWTASIHGADSDIAVQDFMLTVQTVSTVQNQATVATAKPPSAWLMAKNSTNSLPSGASTWIYDEGSSPQRQIIDMGSGDVQIRIINLKNAFDYWILNVSNE